MGLTPPGLPRRRRGTPQPMDDERPDTQDTDDAASAGLGPGANTGDARPEDWEDDPAANPDDEELQRVKGG